MSSLTGECSELNTGKWPLNPIPTEGLFEMYEFEGGGGQKSRGLMSHLVFVFFSFIIQAEDQKLHPTSAVS